MAPNLVRPYMNEEPHRANLRYPKVSVDVESLIILETRPNIILEALFDTNYLQSV